MAKSERKSKWKRKFRAIKREKNKAKELLMLNSILSKRDEATEKSNAEMTEETPIGKQLKFITNLNKKFYYFQLIQDDEKMQINDAKVYNTRTKLDKNGNYPGWMNQRAIKKVKKLNKRLKK